MKTGLKAIAALYVVMGIAGLALGWESADGTLIGAAAAWFSLAVWVGLCHQQFKRADDWKELAERSISLNGKMMENMTEIRDRIEERIEDGIGGAGKAAADKPIISPIQNI